MHFENMGPLAYFDMIEQWASRAPTYSRRSDLERSNDDPYKGRGGGALEQ